MTYVLTPQIMQIIFDAVIITIIIITNINIWYIIIPKCHNFYRGKFLFIHLVVRQQAAVDDPGDQC